MIAIEVKMERIGVRALLAASLKLFFGYFGKAI
jgi:hypothetical protein